MNARRKEACIQWLRMAQRWCYAAWAGAGATALQCAEVVSSGPPSPPPQTCRPRHGHREAGSSFAWLLTWVYLRARVQWRTSQLIPFITRTKRKVALVKAVKAAFFVAAPDGQPQATSAHAMRSLSAPLDPFLGPL
eukprot:COSAG01_NODE_3913_length_5545_cov_4.588505_7_plen_136_part_00